jgi:hypothetical protein
MNALKTNSEIYIPAAERLLTGFTARIEARIEAPAPVGAEAEAKVEGSLSGGRAVSEPLTHSCFLDAQDWHALAFLLPGS